MTGNTNPLITIGLTTYNRPDFLKDSVRSIMNQTYKNFRLLIGNDYPESKVTFETLGIQNDARIEIINYEENIGEIRNLNYLLNMADSKWFTWLADDDLLSHVFFEDLLACEVNDDQNLSAIYSDYESGLAPDKFFLKSKNDCEHIKLSSYQFVNEYVSRKIKLIGTCGLLNTQKLKMIGGFPNLNYSSGIYCDGLIPILLAEQGDIIFIKQSLVFLRTHKDSQSAASLVLEEYISAEPNFILSLSRVCISIKDTKFKDKSIFHMVRWFTENEFIVLFRISSDEEQLSFFTKIKKLIKLLIYQVKVNYPRIKIRYWPMHTFLIIKITLSYFFRLFMK
jgi:glycosyltransferase involved in cell wall biosynthesis